jgi:hypothetical protein
VSRGAHKNKKPSNEISTSDRPPKINKYKQRLIFDVNNPEFIRVGSAKNGLLLKMVAETIPEISQ